MTDPYEPVYAAFGETYFQAEILHRGVASLAAISKFSTKKAITRLSYEQELSRAFDTTLGNIVKEIEGVISEEDYRLVEAAVVRRNYLAHHFCWDRCPDMFTKEGLNQVLLDLKQWHEEIRVADEAVSRRLDQLSRETVGLTDELLAVQMKKELAGEHMEPLHCQRQAKKNETIVRIFRGRKESGKFKMIPVAGDGTHWQPGDRGLTWSDTIEVGEGWVPIEEVNRFLPAKIQSRPGESGPWSYAFQLKDGARLVFQPSSNPEVAFLWKLVESK